MRVYACAAGRGDFARIAVRGVDNVLGQKHPPPNTHPNYHTQTRTHLREVRREVAAFVTELMTMLSTGVDAA